MAFPFAFIPNLRRELLLAIGTTTLASFGCMTEHRTPDAGASGGGGQSTPPPTAARGGNGTSGKSGTSGTSGASGGSGTSGKGGTSGTSAGKPGTSGGTPGAAPAGSGAAGKAGMSGVAGMDVLLAGRPGSCTQPFSRSECFTRESMMRQAMYGCGMIPNPPPLRSEAEATALFLPNGCLQYQAACNGCCNPAVEPGIPQSDGSCCYAFCDNSCCGRPLIVDGALRLAGVERRRDWLQDLGAATPGAVSARIGNEWLEDARMEHASVASFARFTLDLLAFGAPADLVAAAQRAGLDEVEHARSCFGLAARYGAGERGPAPLSAAGVQVAASLWDAALAAFDEGCVGETVAALQAQAARDLASDPEVCGVLERIAEDEARHAALAWRFVTWSAGRLGAELVRELERRLQQLTAADTTAEYEPAPVVAALHAAGRLTASDKHRITREGLREVIAPCVKALAGSLPAERSAVAG